jgi:phosphohistidine phosphatase
VVVDFDPTGGGRDNPDGLGLEPSYNRPRQIIYTADEYGWPECGGPRTVGLPHNLREREQYPNRRVIPDFGMDFATLEDEPWWRLLYKTADAGPKPLVLYLVRHGIPEGIHEDQTDDERGLSKVGAKKTAKAFKGLTRLGVQLDRTLSSPARRAQETAKLLSSELGDGAYRTPDGLHHHDFDVKKVLEEIDAAPAGSSLAIVGHHEYLGPLTSLLVDGTKTKAKNEHHGVKYDFASVGRLEFEKARVPGQAHLTALFTPRSLRKLAK